jgi:hypothetical protein
MFRRKLLAPAVALAALAFAAPAFAAPPANDDFEHAVALPPSAVVMGTLDEATRETGEPVPGVRTVWYSFQPSVSQRMVVELASDGGGVGLAVSTGSSLSSLRPIGRSLDYPWRVPFDATAGETYRIAVLSYYELPGIPFRLRVRPAPLPANDSFADAQKVRVPGRYTGNLADATAELGERGGFRGSRPQRSVWFRFKVPRAGKLSIQAVGRDCSTPVAVYTGSRLDALHRVGASYGTVRFRARRGRTYRVAVDCLSPSLGDFELTISDGSIAGKGVGLSVDPGQTVQSVRSRGLHINVTTLRKVRVGIAWLVGARAARQMRLRGGVLGRASGTLDYNQGLPAVIRLTAAARRKLAGQDRLSSVVRLTLLKTDAPNRVLNVPVNLPN